jgi:hypothetical protein
MTTQSTTSYQKFSKCSDSTCCETIYPFILEASQHQVGSRQRDRSLTQAIRAITPKLWRAYTPYYPDALQQTWLYFVKNGCQTYDRDRGCIITWLNSYLWYRHQDLAQQAIKRQCQEVPIDLDAANTEDSYGYALREVSGREYGSLFLLEQVSNWVATDLNNMLRNTHVRGRPDIDAQTLIQLRLPPETSWKNISAQFDVPISTLSGFYRRQCLPLLRSFGYAEGLL